MRREFVGIFLLVLSGCGKAENSKCADVLCAGEGRGECVDLSTDPEHCGACGKECDEGEICEGGWCFGCEEGETQCGTICADLESSSAHCGGCWANCADQEQCVDGACEATGLCGDVECVENEVCVDGVCEVPGPCGDDECEGDEVCVDGACEAPPACEDGQTQCGQRCFDLQTDARHCGSCTNVCPSGLECVAGECACPEEMVDCWFGCLDPSSDPMNCGACGQLCENSTFCEDGTCRCPEGLTSCDGTCVDTQASRFHCGSCGNECVGIDSCVAGSCLAPPSPTSCTEVPVNVEIRRVALYQGVEVDLVSAGVPVVPAERTVEVVRGRDALVRVFVSPNMSFEPTTLVASLVLEGAEVETYQSQPTEVTQASRSPDLASTLNIFVPGAALTAELQFSVQISACQAQPEGSVGAVRVPALDSALLGARRSGEIAVHFLPIEHDGRLPDTSPEVLDLYAREVMRQYPATALSWDLGETIVSDQTGALPDLGLMLDQVTELREQDGPPEHVYYYGLVDPAAELAQYCDGGCTTGIAWWLPTVNDWAKAHRTGVGIGFGTYGANTFAHELGHNLGRDHAPCATEGDLNFPYPGASIGVWGYDPVGGVLKDPSAFTDLMGYCEPNWVSDYTYGAIFERIAATQVQVERRVSNEQSSPTEHEQRWASFIVSGGVVKWARTYTRRGAPSEKPEPGMVYDVDGIPIAQVEVHRFFMADGEGYKVFVPEQQPGWFAVGLAEGIAVPYE